MSDPSIKIKVSMDTGHFLSAIRLTKKELQAIASGAKKAMKSASAGTSELSGAAESASRVFGGLRTVVNRASSAISLFHRALGVLGAISSIIGAASSLWIAVSHHASEAARRTEEANKRLADSYKRIEELNQARLDRAIDYMHRLAEETARARDNTIGLADAATSVASAQAQYEAAKIDLAVATGEKTKEEADAEKAQISTREAVEIAEHNEAAALAKKKAADDVVLQYEHAHPELAELSPGDDGRLDTFHSDAAKKFRSADARLKADKFWRDPSVAGSEHDRELARQNYNALVKLAREYENALAAAREAASEYDAAKLKGDAAVNEAIAGEVRIREAAGKAAADALEKSVRDLAKSQIDLDIQRGTKSRKAGELEKQKLDLEAERKAAAEAVESRRAFLEKDGQAPEADATLTALTNNLETIQNKMDLNEAMANVADEDDRRKGPGSALAITSDRWGRIGAFAGGGSQAESLNIQKGSYDALKAIRIMCDRIHRSMRYQSIPVL